MNLLSVRAGKLLGARAPDFDALRVYGTRGEVFPMLDVKPDYVLDSRVLADVLADTAQVKSYLPDDGAEKADAAIARGRNPIQFGTLSDSDAAGIISEIFGGAGADTVRGALGAADGIPDKCKEKILRGLAHLAPDLTSNMQSAPSPEADLKSRDQPGVVLSDLSGPHPVCEIGPFRGARYSISFLDSARDYAAVYFLKNKRPACVIAALKKFLAECRALDPTYRIRVLRTDRGSEYLNSEMDDFAGAAGFVPSPGAASATWFICGAAIGHEWPGRFVYILGLWHFNRPWLLPLRHPQCWRPVTMVVVGVLYLESPSRRSTIEGRRLFWGSPYRRANRSGVFLFPPTHVFP